MMITRTVSGIHCRIRGIISRRAASSSGVRQRTKQARGQDDDEERVQWREASGTVNHGAHPFDGRAAGERGLMPRLCADTTSSQPRCVLWRSGLGHTQAIDGGGGQRQGCVSVNTGRQSFISQNESPALSSHLCRPSALSVWLLPLLRQTAL